MQWRALVTLIGCSLLLTLAMVGCRQQKTTAGGSSYLSPEHKRAMDLLRKVEKTRRLSDAEFEQAMQLARHPDELVSSVAYGALAYVTDPRQKQRAAALFRQSMNHRSGSIRIAACSGLGFVGSPEDVPLILSCLRDPDATVRLVALRSLRSLGGPAHKEHVRAMLQDPDPEVRQLAQQILQEWETKSQRRR